MTMRERMAAGKLYTDECEGLQEERIAAKRKMRAFNDSDPGDPKLRADLLRDLLGKAENVLIESPFYVCYGTHIFIGEGSFINFNCSFLDDGPINIGKNVLIGPAVSIATAGHPVCPGLREYIYTAAVTIEDNCWIGTNVTICPGVTVGKNSVIGAGSVVVKDIPENTVAAGNPCKVIRRISERDRQYYFRDRMIEEEERTDE